MERGIDQNNNDGHYYLPLLARLQLNHCLTVYLYNIVRTLLS